MKKWLLLFSLLPLFVQAQFNLASKTVKPRLPDYGWCTHFGTANNGDYKASNTDFGIYLAKRMHSNAIKSDFSISGSGIPSNTNANNFVNKARAANLRVWALFSTKNTNSTNSPAHPANPDLTIPSSGFTTAELTSLYNQGYNKGFGFATWAAGRIYAIEIGNELDINTEVVIKAKAGGQTTPLPEFGVTTMYNMETYPGLLAEIQGAYAGIRAADPKILIGMNYAFTHQALLLRLYRDIKTVPAYLPNKTSRIFDFIANHAYNNEENNAAYQTKGMTNLINLWNPLYPGIKIGFTESGYFIDGPNHTTQTQSQYLRYFANTYAKQVAYLFVYELFNEVASRTGREAAFGITDPSATPTTLTTSAYDLSDFYPRFSVY